MYKPIALIALLIAAPAWAGSFTTIADTTTAIPGGSGNFTSFSPGPAIDAGNVAFTAFGSNGQNGVYLTQPGGVATLADTNTKIPADNGGFVSYPSNPHFNAHNTSFFATGSGGQQGIFASHGGTLSTVADQNTLVPNASDKSTFTTFGGLPAISGNFTAFAGNSATAGGIYVSTSSGLAVVADNNTHIPNGIGNLISSAPIRPTRASAEAMSISSAAAAAGSREFISPAAAISPASPTPTPPSPPAAGISPVSRHMPLSAAATLPSPPLAPLARKAITPTSPEILSKLPTSTLRSPAARAISMPTRVIPALAAVMCCFWVRVPTSRKGFICTMREA
jgi:hypothetical protein